MLKTIEMRLISKCLTPNHLNHLMLILMEGCEEMTRSHLKHVVYVKLPRQIQ
jgi:hypothetical protein